MTELLLYLAYSLIVIVGVYILPGLALVPRVIFDSRLAYALPIMSVLVVIGLARTAKFLGIFTEAFAMSATLAFAAVACYRLWHLRQTTSHWPNMHRLIYLTSIFLMLPAAAVSSIAIFAGYDVVAMWNPWAIQHMQGLPYDQSLAYNESYPQNYPYLLAWCFNLLGSDNLQLPIKSGFSMLGISFVAAIGMVGQHCGANNLLAFLAFIVLAVVLLYVGSWEPSHTFALYNISYHDWRSWSTQSLSAGYASILLVPPIVVSIVLYLQHQRSPESPYYVWLAAGAAVVAGLARQEAYVWLMGAFPFLVALEARKQNAWNAMYPVVIAWCIGLLWLMTEGWNPHYDGAMHLAFGSGARSGVLEQLQHMFDLYVLNEPTRAIILAACVITVLLYRRGLGVFLTYLIPCFMIWTFAGAHTPRHGLHIGAIAVLLIVANSFGWISFKKYTGTIIPNPVRYLVCTIAIFSAIYAGFLVRETIRTYYGRYGEFSLLDARKNRILRSFGEQGEYVYREIVVTNSSILAPETVTRGIFYGSNPLFFPEDLSDVGEYKIQIKRTIPDFLIFEKGGTYSRYLDPFIKNCPAWFEPIAIPVKSYGYKVYRIDGEAVKSVECDS